MTFKDIKIENINGVDVLKATHEEVVTTDVAISKIQIEECIAELTAERTKFQNLLARFS